MGYFTLRNTTLLALVQIGVIVAGVLTSGAAYQLSKQADLAPPRSVVVVSEYGWLALLIPLAWIIVTLELQRRAEDEGVAALIAYLSGLLVLLLLLVSVSYLVIGPGFRLLFSPCG
jgi:hypothetical protein